jgi:hypothetical protein
MADRERDQLVAAGRLPIIDTPGFGSAMDPILPQTKLLPTFGRPRTSLVRDVVRHAREGVHRGDVRPHRPGQQARRDGKILVMGARERLAHRIRARQW